MKKYTNPSDKAADLKTPTGYSLIAVATKRDLERIKKVLTAAKYKMKYKRFTHDGKTYYAIYAPATVRDRVIELITVVKENGVSAAMAILGGIVGGLASGTASALAKEYFREKEKEKKTKKNTGRKRRRKKVCVPPTTYRREGKIIHRKGYCRRLPTHVKSGDMRIPPAGVVPKKYQRKIEEEAREELLKTLPNIGKYWRVQVLPPEEFEKGSFRTHDIGRPEGHKRIAGILKKYHKWATQSFLLPLNWYEREGNTLIPLTDRAKRFWRSFSKRYAIKWVGGARFVAVPKSAAYYKKNPSALSAIEKAVVFGVPEGKKPTPAMIKAHKLAAEALKIAAKKVKEGYSRSEALKKAWKLVLQHHKVAENPDLPNQLLYIISNLIEHASMTKIPDEKIEYLNIIRGIGHVIPVEDLKEMKQYFPMIYNLLTGKSKNIVGAKKEAEELMSMLTKTFYTQTKENGQYFVWVAYHKDNPDKGYYIDPSGGLKFLEQIWDTYSLGVFFDKHLSPHPEKYKYIGLFAHSNMKSCFVGDYYSGKRKGTTLYDYAKYNFTKIEGSDIAKEVKEYLNEVGDKRNWVVVCGDEWYASLNIFIKRRLSLKDMYKYDTLAVIPLLSRLSDETGGGDIDPDKYECVGKCACGNLYITTIDRIDTTKLRREYDVERCLNQFYVDEVLPYLSVTVANPLIALALTDTKKDASELSSVLSQSGIPTKVVEKSGYYVIFVSKERFSDAVKIRDAYLKEMIPRVAANPKDFKVETHTCPYDGAVLQFVKLGTKPDGNVAPVFRCPVCKREYFV